MYNIVVQSCSTRNFRVCPPTPFAFFKRTTTTIIIICLPRLLCYHYNIIIIHIYIYTAVAAFVAVYVVYRPFDHNILYCYTYSVHDVVVLPSRFMQFRKNEHIYLYNIISILRSLKNLVYVVCRSVHNNQPIVCTTLVQVSQTNT